MGCGASTAPFSEAKVDDATSSPDVIVEKPAQGEPVDKVTQGAVPGTTIVNDEAKTTEATQLTQENTSPASGPNAEAAAPGQTSTDAGGSDTAAGEVVTLQTAPKETTPAADTQAVLEVEKVVTQPTEPAPNLEPATSAEPSTAAEQAKASKTAVQENPAADEKDTLADSGKDGEAVAKVVATE